LIVYFSPRFCLCFSLDATNLISVAAGFHPHAASRANFQQE
jgi:hypothetical protein